MSENLCSQYRVQTPAAGSLVAGQPQKESFEADTADAFFSVLAFALGFSFVRWVFFRWQGWSVTLFTVTYLGVVTFYLRKKGIKVQGESRFWLAITLLTGLSYSLWSNHGLGPWRSLMLFCCAVYWVLSTTGVLLQKKTGNFMVFDFFNGLVSIPFKNFDGCFKSWSHLARKKRPAVDQVFSIGLGIVFALVVFCLVFPLLLEADSGGFSRATRGILQYLQAIPGDLAELIFQLLIAVPTAAYIFGLVAGSARKRGGLDPGRDNLDKKLANFRLLPVATVYTLLGLVCSLYVLFIASQIPYFFSAFAGTRPEGWLVYSEYARRGFFELCAIAAINMSLLIGANLCCRVRRQENLPLKIFNILLAAITLLLIATAFSKMALYIGAYGLSVRRLLPSSFLVFLAVVCSAVIALQKRQFSIVKLAAMTGVAMLCLLCLVNPDGLVARYNANRYLSGTLADFDVSILYRGGPAGVQAARLVYNQTADPGLKEQLSQYIDLQQRVALDYAGKPWDNLEYRLVRNR